MTENFQLALLNWRRFLNYCNISPAHSSWLHQGTDCTKRKNKILRYQKDTKIDITALAWSRTTGFY